jgi:hypothetical protein
MENRETQVLEPEAEWQNIKFRDCTGWEGEDSWPAA